MFQESVGIFLGIQNSEIEKSTHVTWSEKFSMAPRMERFKRPSLEDCEDRILEVFLQSSGGVLRFQPNGKKLIVVQLDKNIILSR